MESTLKKLLTHLWDGLSHKPGRSLISPGSETVWDDCCDGQLSIRLTAATLNYARNACPVGMTVGLEVELVRCVATLEDDGQAPSDRAVTSDALAILQDMRELGCALSSFKPDDPGVSSFRVLEYTPTALEGGCGGGRWSVELRTGLPWLG